MARVVLPGYTSHHPEGKSSTKDAFFKKEDYLHYLELLKTWCDNEQLEVYTDD